MVGTRLGWVLRGGALLALVATTGGIARRAQACEPPLESGFYPDIVAGAVGEVPTDGVIAFSASAYGPLDVALALLGIEVTLDGVVVDGAIETVELSSTEGDYESHRLIVVWRPSVAFEASAQYVASVSIADELEGEPTVTALDVPVGAGPAGALPVLVLGDPELTAIELDSGRRVCCAVEDDGGNCGFPECTPESLADQPNLAVELAAIDDPLLSQTYVRQRLGTDGETEPVELFLLGRSTEPASFSRVFTEAADSYCMGFELISLIDGSVAPAVEQCAEHGALELGSRANPALDSFVEACEAPYWQDTNEPYVPDGEDTGGESTDDAGDEAPGTDDDGGDSSEDDGGALDDDSKGCGCDVERDGALMPGLLALVFGIGLRRRRR